MSTSLSLQCLSSIVLLIFSITAQATVPDSATFQFINVGNFGEYDTEYGASYRLLGDIQTSTFALCFYNTTPNAYTFGLRLGSRREDSTSNVMRWIWDANRGTPVGDNATLTFGTNGNLVLADADGKLVWQTDTADKGVVGIELLANGNLVLVDRQGGFVWQSFDYPTNTLLVGQGLKSGESLISRVSDADGAEGAYSLVLENQRLAMYIKSKNTQNPILYYTPGTIVDDSSILTRVVFNSAPFTEEASAYELSYDYYIDNSTDPASSRIVRPKYNTTFSFLRIESDGNLKIYTFYDQVITDSWEVPYVLFNREGRRTVSECKLPTRCGSLGVCMDNQCVGCPSRNGLLWWNGTCAPPTLPACTPEALIKVNYLKVVGVEHFTSDYTQGDGPFMVSECRVKCSRDCGCLGFFYREESSLCLLAYELGTLTKVSDESHVAYIKTPK